ncbi:hypothetical protein [Saccharolobus caldissimus]|uniref:Uncharacterized protein n=1 Tax=Saccharolobus caldissimus TaxID=1702097 RepID=A0AAQ4CWI7_9CREN|nr:hypothetical protein [Saccharolobus caldissimus]BDC00169.1 hypothetical protein SACC_31850 [Saccharolobus caldissimus]
MFKEILGDYEPRGRIIQGVGKFIALGLDDPFHITTITGFTIYGIGKYIERKTTNYGIRMAKIDLENIRKDFRDLILDLSSIRF